MADDTDHQREEDAPDDRKAGDQQGDDDKPENKPQDGEPAPKRPLWPWFLTGAVVLVFVVVVLVLLFWPRSDIKTDDAYVSVRYTSISPQVSGQVAAVHVADNEAVRAGQLLLTLDDRPYRVALDQAQANYAADRALADQAGAQVSRQPALIDQARAQTQQSEAALILSRPRADRYSRLSATGASSVEQRQQAVSQLRSDEATLRSSRASLSASRLQLSGLRAQHASARAKANADLAQVAQARLNLGYTRIHAPFDGTVDQRTVQVGNYVTPGATTMVLVPLDAAYITANYRELALRHMRPGQHARIHVDAYDLWIDGYVQSLPAATGTSFSPIPSTNATGNFTKIVQRLPVKIMVSPGQPLARLLRVGMSVETVVETGLHDVVADQRRSNGRVTQAAPSRAVARPGTPVQ